MSDELEMVITNNNLPLLANLDQQLRDALHKCMKRISVTVEARARGHIQSQDLTWEPLSAAWTKYKQKQGYSSATYIMTSSYMQSITWQYHEAEFKAEIGIMRSAIHVDPETGKIVNLWQIADALEYGYDPKHIPARPLWRPTYEESKRSAQTMIGLTIKKVLDDVAAKAGGATP